MATLIKVCGMTDADNIREVEALGVDLIGFILYPKSPRFLYEVPSYLPTRARRVGVFVNETKDNVLMYADRLGLDFVQLHGNESPDYCRNLQRQGMRIIKAFPIATAHDLVGINNYQGACDYFLFDTRSLHYGGSGQQFDWSLLKRYQGATPFLLSGGIDPYSARQVNQFHHPRMAGVDLNSRFEVQPGLKDVDRLRSFIRGLNR